MQKNLCIFLAFLFVFCCIKRLLEGNKSNLCFLYSFIIAEEGIVVLRKKEIPTSLKFFNQKLEGKNTIKQKATKRSHSLCNNQQI
jgi:hypothetical protein